MPYSGRQVLYLSFLLLFLRRVRRILALTRHRVLTGGHENSGVRSGHPVLVRRKNCSMDMRSCRTTLGNTGFFICNDSMECLGLFKRSPALLSLLTRQHDDFCEAHDTGKHCRLARRCSEMRGGSLSSQRTSPELVLMHAFC